MLENKSGYKYFGKYFNIPLFIHWNILAVGLVILPLFIIKGNIVDFLSLYLTYIFIILFHEFGHAIAAKFYNSEVYFIEVSALGGICYANVANDDYKSALLFVSGGFIAQAVLLTGALIYQNFFGFSMVTFTLIYINILSSLPDIIPSRSKDGRPPSDGYVIIKLLMGIIKKEPYTFPR